MVENQTPTREVTVLDIFKILKNKIKLIAIITLAALVLGAAGGAALAIISNATYGTQAEFYIYSESANGYILSLLRSDSFAERLLLDENGLPSNKKGSQTYNDALAAKEAVDLKLEEIELKEKEIKEFPAIIAQEQRKYNDAQAVYDDLNKRLETYMSVQFENLANDAEIAKLEKALDGIDNEDKSKGEIDVLIARNNAKNAYNAVLDASQIAEIELLSLQDELSKLNATKKSIYDIALTDFRKDKENLDKIQTIKKSVTYNYEAVKDEKILESQAHLYVNIAVKFDKQLAEELLNSISKSLCGFVEESVIAEGEERETECVFLSVFGSVDTVDYKNPLVEAVKFGAIAAIGAIIITSIVIIMTDILSTPKAKEEGQDEQPALEEAND